MLFASVACVLFALVAVTANDAVSLPVSSGEYQGPRLLRGWFRYDGVWYRRIAQDGYFFRGDREISSVAFFPVYPLSMRAFHLMFGGDPAMWGVVITCVSGLVALVFFYLWCVARIGETGARFAAASLLLWPYGWFLFGAVYADAMFIALVIAAFVAIEKDRALLATALAAVATATRPVGIAVVVGLLVRKLERDGVFSLPPRRDCRPKFVGARSGGDSDEGRRPSNFRVEWQSLRLHSALPLLSLAGVGAYAAYLWVDFGDPFAFSAAGRAPGWDLKPGPRTWFKYEFFERLTRVSSGDLLYPMGLILQAVLASALVLLTPTVGRTFGWGYAAFVLVVLVIPLISSPDFQGVGRYALAAFPAFAVIGQRLATHPRLGTGVLAVSTVALSVLCVGYARGKYLA